MIKKAPPVSVADVAAAIRELREEGEMLSVRVVQKRVGRGSLTTISKHMQSVLSGSETPQAHLETLPSKLEALCLEMVATMDELAVERVSEERAQVEAIRRNVESRWNGLLLEKESAVQSLDAEKRSSEELRQRLNEASDKLEQALAEQSEWKTRAASAEALGAQLGQRLAESTEQVERLNGYIANYEKQVEQRRERDRSEHNSRIKEKEDLIAASHQREVEMTARLSESDRMNDKLANQLRDITSRAEIAEAKQVELQELVAALSIEQVEHRKREELLETQAKQAADQKAALLEQVLELQQRVIDIQTKADKAREKVTAENRAVIANMVGHSRRVLESWKAGTNVKGAEFKELSIAQREIEKLFLD